MIAKIEKSRLCGTVTAPTSKSMAHRMLICASLAKGKSVVKNVTFSQDILATLDCIKQMGGQYSINGNDVEIEGISNIKQTKSSCFNCRESGSTLRFFIPLLLLSETKQSFSGSGKLMERPQSVYEEICKEKGLLFENKDEKITVCGALKGGEYHVQGDVSSQFITGLLFALSLCEEDSRIYIKPPLESRSYIDMTADAMSVFGVKVEWEDEFTLFIKGKQEYKAKSVFVEGDYSGSAFLEAFNCFDSDVKINGLNENSLQGDKIYLSYFALLNETTPTLDVSNCPDLAPILMSVAVAKNGAVFKGTKRLKIKESDRGHAMAQELSKFGAKIKVYENEIIVEKSVLHAPKEILSGHNDHRIVMSLAVLATLFGGEIEEAQAVAKSFPDFFEKIKMLGARVDLYDN